MTARPAPHPYPEQVLQWLRGQRAAMLELLEDIVNIDSGSGNHKGVEAVGDRLAQHFSDHGIPVRWHADAHGRGSLSAGALDAPRTGGHIVLMGHRDTVFPDGEAGRRPFRIEGSRAYGPGVADMKGGLVMNAFVLTAFWKSGGSGQPLLALYTTDEEIGSPQSRAVIQASARGARAVFNAEPGRISGNVVTGRKGGTFLRLTVHGKAAHSGANFADGVSAISELAHKIGALDAITDLDAGTTVNTGVIRGGQSVNTVAAHAEALVDLRHLTQDARSAAMQRIEAIVAQSKVSGTRGEIEVMGQFDAFVPTDASRALFGVYQEAMAELGVQVDGEFSGGCSDAGITSALGCPTLCATGPVGGKTHTPEEFLEIDTLTERAEGVARAISRILS